MTHSGGKPHAVGDRGQRYEVSFFNPATNERQVLGWTDDAEGARKMAGAVEAHPSWEVPWITDRRATWWRHKERGTPYKIEETGTLQTAVPLTDGTVLYAYRSQEDGRLWFRSPTEFHDGRFEPTNTVIVGPCTGGIGIANWIPVGERMPDGELVVLAAMQDMDEPVWLCWFNGENWITAEGAPCGDVTHWQPLPEPPK